jgi:hypothetical protein
MLMPDHKEQRMQACADLLEQYETMGDNLLDSIITVAEFWAHHYKLESKRLSVEWQH